MDPAWLGHSLRNSTAKGKEPDLSTPAVMSKDELELKAALEKVTHDKTEYFCHAREGGIPLPLYGLPEHLPSSSSINVRQFYHIVLDPCLPSTPHEAHPHEHHLEAGAKKIYPPSMHVFLPQFLVTL